MNKSIEEFVFEGKSLEELLKDKIASKIVSTIKEKYNVPIMQTGLRNIRRLGSILRHSDWKVTATLGKRNETIEIVILEPGD